MLNDSNALATAVLLNLQDDLPKLVYADWLEENDQEKLGLDLRKGFLIRIITTNDYKEGVVGDGDRGDGGRGDGGGRGDAHFPDLSNLLTSMVRLCSTAGDSSSVIYFQLL